MPRSRRPPPDRLVLHVVNRGNDRRELFTSGRDYAAFLGLVRWAQSKSSMQVLAYAVMPNHWHFVLWPTTAAQLSQFMHDLTGSHAALLRKETRTAGTGHVYQDRYHASVVGSSARYLRTLRYVEANPVRAGLVSRAEQWRWSSVAERIGRRSLISDGPLRLPPLVAWLGLLNATLTAAQAHSLEPRRPRLGIGRLWTEDRGRSAELQKLQRSQM